MSSLATSRNARGGARAIAVAACIDGPRPRRLDEVWGQVGLRSGVMVASFVLLLLTLGLVLLDVAMHPYPRPAHLDQVASQSGAAVRVAGQYAGARFALNQR